jgi:cell wall-associated NlpC family hydrolase
VQKAEQALHKGQSKARLASPIVTTPEQRHVAKTILRTAEKVGADRKEKVAALTTGLQESGLKNLPISGPGGGWRQEESAFYPAEDITNVKKGAQNYFKEAREAGRGKGETPAELSQTVQGSGAGESYYEDNQGEARQLLKQYNQGKATPQAKAQYAAAVKEAKELGLKVSNGRPNVGKPSKQTVTKFKQIKHAANELESKNLPYSWGGGHDANFSPGGEQENGGPGYDCSGAVSFVLHQAGVLSEPLTSGSMGSVLKPGPGAVTVFYNAEHTFMKIGDEYWGTSVGDDGAGGIGKHPTPSASYLAQYSVGHVPGLGRKQALQLGFKPGSLTTTGGSSAEAFPGMTVSPSGTTATIDKGAGTKVDGKAKFSRRPIELSAPQRIAQAERTLKAGDLAAGKEAEGASTSILDALAKKYG